IRNGEEEARLDRRRRRRPSAIEHLSQRLVEQIEHGRLRVPGIRSDRGLRKRLRNVCRRVSLADPRPAALPLFDLYCQAWLTCRYLDGGAVGPRGRLCFAFRGADLL